MPPEIYNKTYDYKNEHLKDYKIPVWNSQNSNLPNDRVDNIEIGKNGLIWLTVDESLVTFDGNESKNAEQNITDKGKYFDYYALATDNNNVKRVYGKDNIYSFDNVKWRKYDSAEIYKVLRSTGCSAPLARRGDWNPWVFYELA